MTTNREFLKGMRTRRNEAIRTLKSLTRVVEVRLAYEEKARIAENIGLCLPETIVVTSKKDVRRMVEAALRDMRVASVCRAITVAGLRRLGSEENGTLTFTGLPGRVVLVGPNGQLRSRLLADGSERTITVDEIQEST
jgi:hypothetical protein